MEFGYTLVRTVIAFGKLARAFFVLFFVFVFSLGAFQLRFLFALRRGGGAKRRKAGLRFGTLSQAEVFLFLFVLLLTPTYFR